MLLNKTKLEAVKINETRIKEHINSSKIKKETNYLRIDKDDICICNLVWWSDKR